MSFGSRLFAVSLLLFTCTNSALAQDAPERPAEPITLANIDKIGLLTEVKNEARFIEYGPGPNELLLFPGDTVAKLEGKELKVLREIENEQNSGYAFSQDLSFTSWLQGTQAIIRNEASGETIKIDAGERPGAAVFSPDNRVVAIGDMIITGSEGEGYSLLRIFDTKTGDLIRKLEISMDGYGALRPVFSPDGEVLAVGNRNYQTKLFDTETWNLQHTLPKRMTQEIAFSPDGKTLAAGYVDGHLGLWDVESGKEIHMVESGCSEVLSIAWNSAGDLLATAGPAGGTHGPNNTWIRQPGKVLLWNPKTFKVVKELMDVQWSASVRFTADDTRLLSVVTKKQTLDDSPRIAIWSTDAPPMADTSVAKADVPVIPIQRSIALPALSAPTIAVNPDGTHVVAPLPIRDKIAKWDLETGEQEFVSIGQHDWQVWQIVFSPDGSTVATASLDETAKLWDAKTGAVLATMRGHTDRLKYITFSTKGNYILTGTGKQWPYSGKGNVSARLWDAKTGDFIAELESHIDTIRDAKFSEDEALVVTSSDDHTARLWEVESGKELHAFDLNSGLRTIKFSPDGKTILTTSSGRKSNYVQGGRSRRKAALKLWDVTTGKPVFEQALPQAVTATFTESGEQLVSECRGQITYWDIASGEKLVTLREPLIGTEVVFCPNGQYFVVLPPDEPLELWSVADRKQIAWIEIDKPFRSFFSADSATFYSLTRAGEFRSWSMPELTP